MNKYKQQDQQYSFFTWIISKSGSIIKFSSLQMAWVSYKLGKYWFEKNELQNDVTG